MSYLSGGVKSRDPFGGLDLLSAPLVVQFRIAMSLVPMRALARLNESSLGWCSLHIGMAEGNDVASAHRQFGI